MTQVYLIRHGEAANNVGTEIGPDGALTDLGVRQAERLRDRLAATGEIQADVLIASTMARARQTAEIIAPALGLPIIHDEDVEERRLGDADGMPRDAALAKWPRPNYAADPHAEWMPGSETPPVFTARVSRALTRITAEHAGKTIVVVCHGGAIGAAFLFFQGLDMIACVGGGGVVALPEYRDAIERPWVPNYVIRNTSITQWRLSPHSALHRPAWQFVTSNDALHLLDLESDTNSDSRIDWSAFARPHIRAVPIA